MCLNGRKPVRIGWCDPAGSQCLSEPRLAVNRMRPQMASPCPMGPPSQPARYAQLKWE